MKLRNWVVPIGLGGMVVVLGLTLLVVGARSPYTHANRNPAPEAAYTRTQQILVGTPVAYVAPGLADPASASSDEVTLGGQLFVAENCASCHGITGSGGTFAPPVRGFKVATLTEKTHAGPGGMPAFADLTDAQLQAIAAFLNQGTSAPAAAAR